MKKYILPEYHMALEGLMPPPSHVRWQDLRDYVPNVDIIVPIAVEKVYEAVRFGPGNRRPRRWESAWEYLEREMVVKLDRHTMPEKRERITERLHRALLALTMDVAKTSPRYWGVDDPAEESYCSYCKGPQPLANFNQSRFTCDDCFTRRRGTHQ